MTVPEHQYHSYNKLPIGKQKSGYGSDATHYLSIRMDHAQVRMEPCAQKMTIKNIQKLVTSPISLSQIPNIPTGSQTLGVFLQKNSRLKTPRPPRLLQLQRLKSFAFAEFELSSSLLRSLRRKQRKAPRRKNGLEK